MGNKTYSAGIPAAIAFYVVMLVVAIGFEPFHMAVFFFLMIFGK